MIAAATASIALRPLVSNADLTSNALESPAREASSCSGEMGNEIEAAAQSIIAYFLLLSEEKRLRPLDQRAAKGTRPKSKGSPTPSNSLFY
jgi:hypothetical protein